MSSLWTNLLLLHGHIHDPELVRRLTSASSIPPPERAGGTRPRVHSLLAAIAALHVCLARPSPRPQIAADTISKYHNDVP